MSKDSDARTGGNEGRADDFKAQQDKQAKSEKEANLDRHGVQGDAGAREKDQAAS